MESNVTLEAETLLSFLNSTAAFTVKDESGTDYSVTILESQVAAGMMMVHFHSLWLLQIVTDLREGVDSCGSITKREVFTFTSIYIYICIFLFVSFFLFA